MDFLMVPLEGLEPPRLSAKDFESSASTISPQGHGVWGEDLNLRRDGFQPSALPTELPKHSIRTSVLITICIANKTSYVKPYLYIFM